MKGAMRAGAKSREVLEVILQSAVNFVQPSMLHSLKIFVELMSKEGRLAQIGNPPARENTD
jgi:alkylhydroperoxidase/carboxymuconolactone decarboxylase family protein YurZ